MVPEGKRGDGKTYEQEAEEANGEHDIRHTWCFPQSRFQALCSFGPSQGFRALMHGTVGCSLGLPLLSECFGGP
eukprot:7251017-Pyramimonas_sp.AAC.1